MDGKAAIRPLAVPERDGAGVHLALLGVVFHAPANILGEGCAVIFSRPLQHGFQQNPLRAVRDGLLCIEDPYPGLFQPELVCGRIVAVPGKAVDLPADHISPVAVSGILQHLLELGAVIGSARQMPIGVDLHHPEVVLPGKNLAVRHLLLDGTVPLVMGRVPSVDHGVLHIRLKHGRFLFCTHSEQPPAAHRGRLFYLDMRASAILTYFFAEMFPARNSCLHRSISACASSSAALLPLRLTFGQSSSIPSSEARR